MFSTMLTTKTKFQDDLHSLEIHGWGYALFKKNTIKHLKMAI